LAKASGLGSTKRPVHPNFFSCIKEKEILEILCSKFSLIYINIATGNPCLLLVQIGTVILRTTITTFTFQGWCCSTACLLNRCIKISFLYLVHLSGILTKNYVVLFLSCLWSQQLQWNIQINKIKKCFLWKNCALDLNCIFYTKLNSYLFTLVIFAFNFKSLCLYCISNKIRGQEWGNSCQKAIIFYI
jgi:hypothetical protein